MNPLLLIAAILGVAILLALIFNLTTVGLLGLSVLQSPTHNSGADRREPPNVQSQPPDRRRHSR